MLSKSVPELFQEANKLSAPVEEEIRSALLNWLHTAAKETHIYLFVHGKSDSTVRMH